MIEITLPQVGNTMEDGTIVRWVKKEGDTVAKGDILLEVETDKATIEIESNAAGTLRRILTAEGTTVPIHTPIAIIADPDEDISEGITEAEPQEAQVVEKEEQPAPSPPPTPTGNVTPIVLPQAGNTMEEGTIVKWHVAVGDMIEKGQIIFDVETDKATIEVEAADSGRIARIVAEEGQTVEVKRPVAYLADNDADVDAYLESQGAIPPTPEQAPAPAAVSSAPVPQQVPTDSGRIKASPAARKLAREKYLDLASVGPGSGPGGRILSTDVSSAASITPSAPIETDAPVRRRMSSMRRAIARNLLTSKQNIPHFYMELTINADPLYAFYKCEKAKYPCTVNDVIVAACGKGIGEFPALRSRLDTESNELIEYPTANIGIAVGLDNGLVVPVLVGADRMKLREIASESRRIVEGARSGKIEGMGQGVFTITNLGMFGIERFSAIINPPEAGILAVGAIREDVVVRDGEVKRGRVMTMTLSADHRVVDGVLGAQFMQRLKEILESPEQLA